MRAYMENGRFDAVIREIEHPDVFLWAIWAIQQYAKHEGVEKARELYGDFVKEVIDYIRDQKHPDMKLMENGLLFANGKDKAITWMNSTVDWSVRPNMIFAVALPYSPLTRMQKRAVVDIVTKELLTPKGLRSLSPKSEGYRPYYVGPQYERDLAYHQGTAWPWLLGAYLEAYLRVFGKSGVAFAERMLISLEEEMSLHCIGTIPELFDGNPPFTGRGAVSFAMNVAAILRVVDLLKKYNAE